jgi:hypothetical protein
MDGRMRWMEAKRVRRAELLDCRDGCAEWLRSNVGELGEDERAAPEPLAHAVLARPKADAKAKAVAAVLDWLCNIGLAQFDQDDAHPTQAILLSQDMKRATVIEFEAASEREIRRRKRCQKDIAQLIESTRMLGGRLDRLVSKMGDIRGDLSALHDEATKRMRAGRAAETEYDVVLLTDDGAGDPAPDLLRQMSEEVDARAQGWWSRAEVAEQALVAARKCMREAEVCLTQVNRNRPATMRQDVLHMTTPAIQAGWKRCRGKLDEYLRAAGFKPREIAFLLPDGAGDAAARVSTRLYREKRARLA